MTLLKAYHASVPLKIICTNYPIKVNGTGYWIWSQLKQTAVALKVNRTNVPFLKAEVTIRFTKFNRKVTALNVNAVPLTFSGSNT